MTLAIPQPQNTLLFETGSLAGRALPRLVRLASELQDLLVSPSPGLKSQVLIITTGFFRGGRESNSDTSAFKTVYQQGHLPRPLNFLFKKY